MVAVPSEACVGARSRVAGGRLCQFVEIAFLSWAQFVSLLKLRFSVDLSLSVCWDSHTTPPLNLSVCWDSHTTPPLSLSVCWQRDSSVRLSLLVCWCLAISVRLSLLVCWLCWAQLGSVGLCWAQFVSLLGTLISVDAQFVSLLKLHFSVGLSLSVC